MTLKAISALRIFDGEKMHYESALLWKGNYIVAIIPVNSIPEEAEVIRYPSATITPGFIDLQVNGGGGVMFNQQTDVKGIKTICSAHRKHGTAYLLPTLISDSQDKIKQALLAANAALESNTKGILGVHLEGPWLSPEKNGAHDTRHFYDPSVESLQTLPWLSQGRTLVTLAPEAVNNEAVQWLSRQGVLVSCGHSNANAQQLSGDTLSYVDGFTHLYNAMSPLTGREPGVVGAALMTDHAWCSVITDGIHVAPENVKLAHRVKPKGKLLIVSDAMASVGSENNSFILNNETIRVIDNKLTNSNGSLAGAHIGMDQSVANVIKWGLDEQEAFKMASTYPAHALRSASSLGYLKTGFIAAATILDSHYQAQAVLVDGKLFTKYH
ncbi:N-acetylglucosamine-6-phosphate deacetylase [Vibrio aestuarianus]|uniref:N-acetylglucosamine-6-phosphate deacetylase n=1 Tax=Vibrio aestuarianus TaxID=28171 RepID=UPI00237C6CC1|nr:N-acetylglucosamine-6-phosphate deacetylase [Vibrio aestuarianus]MDE1221528.1 N-acetylglucosamine-6-phosphate deacetylase [Vibrio aestuarianus]MDE1224693.1 N-acetylglucosamine-6-phosphate deacetylase [Vibrio aestuarianus]MDE1340921.1 N-acetylglucosamine-6-phosphate deacetylase [Vibrio aestuarianus]